MPRGFKMSHLNIPMSPADLHQQKLYEVKALPKWPVGCGVMLLGGFHRVFSG